MVTRSLGNIVVSAGLGAVATVAGLFVARKMKNYLSHKPKMKLFQKHLSLSTRCAWLISELGAEADFDVTEDIPLSLSQCTSMEMLMIEESHADHKGKTDRERFPLLPYNPNRDDTDDDLMNYDLDYPDSAYDSPTTPFSSRSILPAVVVNDEFTMIEGAAICMYLADLYGQFLPEAEHKAEYYSWIVYSAATFDNIIKTLQRELVDNSEASRNQAALESAIQGFHAFARALSESLEHRLFLCGKRFTAADCVLGFTLWWAYTLDNGHLLSEHPILMQYLERLKDRPAFQKTFGTEPENWNWSNYFSTYVRGVQNYED